MRAVTSRPARRNLRPGKAARARQRGETEITHQREQALGQERKQERKRQESINRAPDARVLIGKTKWQAPSRIPERDCLLCTESFEPRTGTHVVCGHRCQLDLKRIHARAKHLRKRLGLPPPAPPPGMLLRPTAQALDEDLALLAEHDAQGLEQLVSVTENRSTQDRVAIEMERIAAGMERMASSMAKIVELLEELEEGAE